ncbi:hypothetical protein MNB_SV-3-1055 [hydrothermal vent metagenome]|uniref:Uncharacterized protein n=1 Tax=hydrothermal vent metagenome TaxID=652676 RepID=A0A1W1C5U9_9ZZZZ
MNKFLFFFIRLTIVFSAIFMGVAIFYFQSNYSFTNALRLGVLSGFFAALALSFIVSIFLSFFHIGQKTPPHNQEDNKESLSKSSQEKTPKKPSAQKKHRQKNVIPTQKETDIFKYMLLMDKEVAHEIILYCLETYNIGEITTSPKGTLHIQTEDEILKIDISAMTKHTTQLFIHAKQKSEAVDKIVAYLKKKESSFLDY